jgi:hypothetical protein|tara:strand:+ start:156 stop:929 length:774 start_codon:yes stop_codon:yes gene_type:complete
MSVIGTTLKQPRVFAHDAVQLKDLPGCMYAGAKGFDVLTGQGDPGTGFENGKCYRTYNETTGGYGATVQVVTTGASGEILTVDLCEDGCGTGTMYSVGDILTVIWEESSTYTAGTNSTGFVQVDAVSFSEWNYGCPFSPMENRILTEKQVEDLSGVVGYEANPSSLMQKKIVKWVCDPEAEEGETKCEHATFNPGASLYIGQALKKLDVIMESGNKASYTNIPAGTFLPILCLTICDAVDEEEEKLGVEEAEILVLF